MDEDEAENARGYDDREIPLEPFVDKPPYYKRTGTLSVDKKVAHIFMSQALASLSASSYNTFSSLLSLLFWFHYSVPWEIWSTLIFYGIFRFKLEPWRSRNTSNIICAIWYAFYTSRTFLKCFNILLLILPLWRIFVGDVVVLKLITLDFLYIAIFMCVWYMLHQLNDLEVERARDFFVTLPNVEGTTTASDLMFDREATNDSNDFVDGSPEVSGDNSEPMIDAT